jgi:hypothetical protein
MACAVLLLVIAAIAVVLRVLLGSLFVMVHCVQLMAVSKMGMLGGLGMITLVLMIRCQFVVLGRLFVMLGGFFVMVRYRV